MATAVIPGTDRLNPQFAQLAKHYGVDVAICPAHRPQRKGVVEAAIKFIGGRWWRTARAASMLDAQQSLDAFSVNISDRRGRRGSTVGELGAAEPLRALPALAFPAEIVVDRVCSRSALVLFETNKYSVPPGYARQPLTVRARVGEPHLRIVTATGIKVATHRRAPAGAEQTVRSTEHAVQLERAVLDAFTTQTACRSKINRPPGDEALAELAKLHGHARPGRAGRVTDRLREAGGGGVLMGADTIYQQLRSHLAYLKFGAAADALAPALEAAERDKPGYTQFLHDLLAIEVAACEQRRLDGRMRFSRAPRPQDARAVRLHRATHPRPPARRGPRHPQVRRGEIQLLADRPARRRQDTPGYRARPQGSARRLPRLLHNRRRPRRPHLAAPRWTDGGRTRCGSGPDRRF